MRCVRRANGGRRQFAFQTPIQRQIDNRHQSRRCWEPQRTIVPAFQSHESIFLSSAVFLANVLLESRALTTIFVTCRPRCAAVRATVVDKECSDTVFLVTAAAAAAAVCKRVGGWTVDGRGSFEWREKQFRRLAQVERIQDTGDRYNAWVATMPPALVAQNFTENGWGLNRPPRISWVTCWHHSTTDSTVRRRKSPLMR